MDNKRLTKVQRQTVLDALVKTLSDNFKILNEAQVRGIAIHFMKHMAPVIAKSDAFIKTANFGTQEMKDAFAEVLAKRILHIDSLDETPQITGED